MYRCVSERNVHTHVLNSGKRKNERHTGGYPYDARLQPNSQLGRKPDNDLSASLRSANIDALATVELDNGGLDDMPATVLDRDKLLAHLGRDALHGSKSRNFSHAYFRN